MKVALLCLCLTGITAAWPVSKSKQHAISASSEEKYDPRGHHSHKYQHHVNSQSWESLQHPQNDLESPQQTLYSSEESVDVPVQTHFPDVSSKSHEDVDDNDDNDSNDTDESDEVVTSFPTDIPVTFPPFPFSRGDNAGRGDSVAYRMRAKAKVVKSSKLHKTAKKLLGYDATEEDESALDADSQQAGLSWEDPAAHHLLGKHTIIREWTDKSHGHDSIELDSKQHDQSMENGSQQKFDSHEAERDDSQAGVRRYSHESIESRESQVHVSAEIPDDNNSNQTLESAENAQGHHSIKNNEVTL